MVNSENDDFHWQLQDHEAEQRQYEDRIAEIRRSLDELIRIEAQQDSALRTAINELKESLNKVFDKPKKGELW